MKTQCSQCTHLRITAHKFCHATQWGQRRGIEEATALKWENLLDVIAIWAGQAACDGSTILPHDSLQQELTFLSLSWRSPAQHQHLDEAENDRDAVKVASCERLEAAADFFAAARAAHNHVLR
jgi:hypothetical protein